MKKQESDECGGTIPRTGKIWDRWGPEMERSQGDSLGVLARTGHKDKCHLLWKLDQTSVESICNGLWVSTRKASA